MDDEPMQSIKNLRGIQNPLSINLQTEADLHKYLAKLNPVKVNNKIHLIVIAKNLLSEDFRIVFSSFSLLKNIIRQATNSKMKYIANFG